MVPNGTSTQKSTEFLTELLKDESAWEKVMNEYLLLAKQFGADGIEIDFEKVDSAMYEVYSAFLKKLYNTAQEHEGDEHSARHGAVGADPFLDGSANSANRLRYLQAREKNNAIHQTSPSGISLRASCWDAVP